MVARRGGIEKIPTTRQTIKKYEYFNGNNDSWFRQERYCHYSKSWEIPSTKVIFFTSELDIYIFPRPFDCEIVSNMT